MDSTQKPVEKLDERQMQNAGEATLLFGGLAAVLFQHESMINDQ